MKNKKIFTYLSTNPVLPSYLNLCIKTWEINLPEGYEIIVLNEENLKQYMPDGAYNSIPGECSFPFFLDYVCASVLYNHGGIFLQPDMIMTEKFRPNDILLNLTELVMFSNDGKDDVSMGYMMAKEYSEVLGCYIKRFWDYYSNCNKEDKPRNGLMSEIVKNSAFEAIMSIDSENFGFYMERSLFGVRNDYIYDRYYFESLCNPMEFFGTTKGLTALEDSWTREKYRKMEEDEFLNQDILLSRILKEIIEPSC